MEAINKPYFKLKEKIDESDYRDINELKELCLKGEDITLKLELDYKLNRARAEDINTNQINEFMYYDEDKLVGYIGICQFGGTALELNGMVHPDYRRRGIFKSLYSLAQDQWTKRKSEKVLLLSDSNSTFGIEFIKHTGAHYHHSEYEMFLRRNPDEKLLSHNVVLRKAENKDARAIAWQNSIYFNIEFKEEDIKMPEDEEKYGTITYMAEVDNLVIGKVNLEVCDGIGGIFGLGVLPKYRKKGYGSEILAKSINLLKERGAKEIMLQVVTKNENALNLYRRCGFKETSVMDYYEI